MSRLPQVLASSIAGLILLASPALADDWTAVQLRGQVLQLVDTQWQPLARGMVVPDSRVVRTLAFGRVTFTRGEETVELGPNTQIEIHDRGSAARPSTTVTQYFGAVSVEAQVENVQHFAVQTPFLAAVVKGTRFTVTSGKTGAAVSVRRGHVEVDDHRNKSHVLLSAGQSATVDGLSADGAIVVSGSGTLPAVLAADDTPAAAGSNGQDADSAAQSDSTSSATGSDSGESSSGSSSGNGKGNSGNGKGNGGPNGKHSGKGNS